MPQPHDYDCTLCGDDIPSARYKLGYRTCMMCGEEAARAIRAAWCVVQEYGKGAYQLVTPTAARQTLRETNQKNPR
jgi:hypothetical protein